MSRQIMGVTDSKVQVDHINGNTLDNRRENLRLATHGQNRANSKSTAKSGYKGVTYRPRPGRRKHYEVSIRKDSKTNYFGAYYTAEEAALVYNREIVKFQGEFVRLNEVVK